MFKKSLYLSICLFSVIQVSGSDAPKLNIDDAKSMIYLEFENANYELADQLVNNMLKLMGFNELGINEAGKKQFIEELTVNIVINSIIEELARAKAKKLNYAGPNFGAASGSSEDEPTIACPVCTYLNSLGRTNCEICRADLQATERIARSSKPADLKFAAPTGSLTERLLRE